MNALSVLLVQIAVVLVAARVMGALFRLMGQPQVVGEMAAGILLGPSFMGWIAPEFSAKVFPVASLANLGAVSQVGLLLFMFIVGLEFDPKLLRGRGNAAVVTSHASIVAPFFLGSLLAIYLYPRLSDDSVGFTGFALFLGAAMSVTAFPVLARILSEQNLLRTRVGAVTIACAAIDDVTAWAILAVVIAIVRASEAHVPLWVTLAGSVVYVMVMVWGVRRALQWFERRHEQLGRVDQTAMTVAFLGLLASAWITEELGIHALFGAFCFGAIMPKSKHFVHQLNDKLEDLTVLFLLPLFFANAGLRTQIGLVQGAEMWGYFGLIMLVAVAGKFGGSTIAARVSGLNWREAGALGILMNTRGLMELVILTIGIELGVISPALFAMMVFMALLTTCMTTPILQVLYPLRLLRAEEAERGDAELRVLVPVGIPSSGPGLLRVARALVAPAKQGRIYPLHLREPSHELTDIDETLRPEDEHCLRPLIQEADRTGLPVRPMVFSSQAPARDIVEVAHLKGAHWIVIGWHKPVMTQRVLGGAVYDVLTQARCHVAVYVERDTRPWKTILVAHRAGESDHGALDVAVDIARADSEVRLKVLDSVDKGGATLDEPFLREPGLAGRVQVIHVETDEPLDALVEHAQDCDLVVVGVSRTWGLTPQFFGVRHERIAGETKASLLLVRRRSADSLVPPR